MYKYVNNNSTCTYLCIHFWIQQSYDFKFQCQGVLSKCSENLSNGKNKKSEKSLRVFHRFGGDKIDFVFFTFDRFDSGFWFSKFNIYGVNSRIRRCVPLQNFSGARNMVDFIDSRYKPSGYPPVDLHWQ